MLSDSFSQDNLFAKTKVSKFFFSQTGYKSSASPTIFYKLVSLIGFFFFFFFFFFFLNYYYYFLNAKPKIREKTLLTHMMFNINVT